MSQEYAHMHMLLELGIVSDQDAAGGIGLSVPQVS
jgi:hypothetical protein